MPLHLRYIGLIRFYQPFLHVYKKLDFYNKYQALIKDFNAI